MTQPPSSRWNAAMRAAMARKAMASGGITSSAAITNRNDAASSRYVPDSPTLPTATPPASVATSRNAAISD